MERGVNNTEVLQRDLSYEVFEDVENLKYCIIKINAYWLNERGNIYETVRKHWKVNLNRINKIPYVLASHSGVIVDVFEVASWYAANSAAVCYSLILIYSSKSTLMSRFRIHI